MARQKNDGLGYFPFDTDFFYADRRIKALRARFGSDGVLLYIYLLTEIYRNGYYIWYDRDCEDGIVSELGLTEGFIKQVMAFFADRSLLASILVGTDTAITSPGIQKRYQEAVKRLKRDVYVDEALWLLEERETATCIKVTRKDGKSEKNSSNSGGNGDKSEKNAIKEKKEKEKKGKENIDAAAGFEMFWSVYPKKVRRQEAETAYCDLLLSGTVTPEELHAAALNYAEACRIEGTDKVYHPHNFLARCAFEDYLPGKYKKPKKQEDKGNQFCNFPQRERSREELETLEAALLGRGTGW